MADRFTEGGELLCQWCGEHPVVAQLDEINGPLVCQRCLDRAQGEPEPPTAAATLQTAGRRVRHQSVPRRGIDEPPRSRCEAALDVATTALHRILIRDFFEQTAQQISEKALADIQTLTGVER